MTEVDAHGDLAGRTGLRRSLPTVSVVIPVWNEARHISECLTSVVDQTYTNVVEIIVADGGSDDATRDMVLAARDRDARIRLVDNPHRTQAAGLNLAIAVSTGEVVARLDGHAIWPPHHLERCVELLHETGADNVGGTMLAVGETPVGEAVARAMRSRWGAGGATYRYGTEQCDTETVWLGCFRRSALERVGPFDERFPPHEDYELNHRIRASGGRVVFSPQLPTSYFTRGTWPSVAVQYFRYGRGKMRVGRHFPGVVRPYHLGPPVFVVLTALGGLAFVVGHRRGPLLVGTLYLVSCAAASLPVGRGASTGVRLRIPAVFPVLHGAWGVGFWAGVLEAARGRRVPDRRNRS